MGSSSKRRRKQREQNRRALPKVNEPRDAIAIMVARCRELRDSIDAVGSELTRHDADSFLRRQCLETVEGLMRDLRALVATAGDAIDPALPSGRSPDDETGSGDQAKGEGSRAPALEGNAWTIPIAEFIGFLANNRKTGVLWVNAPYEVFVVEFHHGQLLRASSDRAPKGERLGDVLVRLGHLDEYEIDALVEAAKNRGRHFGRHLLDIGRVTDDELRQALSLQVQALFVRLMSSRNAIYRFQEGNEITDAHNLDLNVTHLLLEGARCMDETARNV